MNRLTIILLICILLTSCATAPPPAASPEPALTPGTLQAPDAAAVQTASPTPAQTDDVRLAAMAGLMPEYTGFQWQYFGIAEYAATLSLTAVTRQAGAVEYVAEGEVEDVSSGEAKGDFSLRVTYRASPDSLSQRIEGEKALDNTFPDIELLRAPLESGAQWVQSVRDGKGRDRSLTCTITGIQTAAERKTYFVTYKDDESEYYEKREITEGRGVTAYDRLYAFDGESDLIGYRYYEPKESPALEGYEQWLPVLGTEYTYFGLAEYGHRGVLGKLSGNDSEDVYEYRGVYADGVGTEDRFVLKYFADRERGTITEKVVSNGRKPGKPEVNSRLHNLVILKFPLRAGQTWEHKARLNGREVNVRAEVFGLEEIDGVARVRYTAQGAEGYYNNTYIEERTFEKGLGMTGFSNLMPGSIGISEDDAKVESKLADALAQHMFGYSMNKSLLPG